GELPGSPNPAASKRDPDALANGVLTRGGARPPPHGRADDFSWPRADISSEPAPDTAPPPAASPAPSQGGAGKNETNKSDANKGEAKSEANKAEPKKPAPNAAPNGAAAAPNASPNAAPARPRQTRQELDGGPPRPPLPGGPPPAPESETRLAGGASGRDRRHL